MQGTQQAPRTRAELESIVQLRAELEEQLRSVTRRRSQLVQERLNAQAAGNPGVAAEYETQIKELGARAARLEAQKLRADDIVTDALARGVGNEHATPPTSVAPPADQAVGLFEHVTTTPPSGSAAARFVESNAVSLLLGEALFFVVAGVVLWRSAMRRLKATTVPGMGQLTTAVDAIALEVERISENQRYVTKLLNEQLLEPGARPAQPIEIRERLGTEAAQKP
jgi:hypothetical protein